MKKIRLSVQPCLDHLDTVWKTLPPGQKRRVVLYSFSGYVLITLLVVAQVIFEVGTKNENLPVEHITNPVIRVVTPAATAPITEPKIRENERK